MIFGEYLKNLRIDRELTLRDVEEQAGISNAYLSQVERGKRSTPTMKILIKLAQVYGIPVSILNDKAEAELKEKELTMPNRDGTGPAGKGSKTGGQRGSCSGAKPRKKPRDGRGQGKGNRK